VTQDDEQSEGSWPTHDTDDHDADDAAAAPHGGPPAGDTTGHAPGTAETAGTAETSGTAESAGAAGATGADATTEPQPAGELGLSAGRRVSRRVMATASLAVVALVVVLALPPVSNRLMLPWAPNKPDADPPEATAVDRTLHGPLTGTRHQPAPREVTEVLQGALDDSALGELTGLVVDAASGETVWQDSPQRPRVPASTTKVLTSAAALLSMPRDRRIPTEVVAGDEPGTVVLVAGGDVTLSSLPEGEESVYPDAAHLDELVKQVKSATDGDVERVALDLSVYSGKTAAPSWEDEDTKYFTADAVPAMLDGGRQDPTATESERVDNPAGKLLHEFADRLGAEAAEDSTVTAPDDARSLGMVKSAPLATLVRRCLQLSDNVLADALARQIAMHENEEVSFSGAARAIHQVLAQHGFDVEGLRLFDGSGLSDQNRASASLLAEILTVAADPTTGSGERAAALGPVLAGLPVAGGTGTLAERYDEAPAKQGRGWVRAKTGTLSKVSTLAGTVLDSDGRLLVFAFMSSGTDFAVARPALDALAAKLRSCGCDGH